MEKYIVYTKWCRKKGLEPAEEMRKNVKPLSPAEDVFGGRWITAITNPLTFILLRMRQRNTEQSLKNFVKKVQMNIQ